MKSMKKPMPSKQMPPKKPDPVRQHYSLALPKGKKK
jgi:hypothetical protein